MSSAEVSAAVSDAEVAEWILSEIENGNQRFGRIFATLAKTGLKMSPIGGLMSEVES
jgi:hypothetical protein